MTPAAREALRKAHSELEVAVLCVKRACLHFRQAGSDAEAFLLERQTVELEARRDEAALHVEQAKMESRGGA